MRTSWGIWFGDVEWNEALEANPKASVKVNRDGSFATIPVVDVFKSILSEAMNAVHLPG